MTTPDHDETARVAHNASAMAAGAVRRANAAWEKADAAQHEAQVYRDETDQSLRTIYATLADIAGEVRRGNELTHALFEAFRQGRRTASVPPPREKVPSAAEWAREITGETKIPSDPATAIVRHGLQGLLVKCSKWAGKHFAKAFWKIAVGLCIWLATLYAGTLLANCHSIHVSVPQLKR